MVTDKTAAFPLNQEFLKSLTSKEEALVKALVEAAGRTVSRGQLHNVLGAVKPRTIDTYLKNIRSKMRASGIDPGIVVTHAGEGYSLSLK
ncbi:MAG: winged helix-turn-helix domain-containing protein [Acidobacteriaceae bacterium]